MELVFRGKKEDIEKFMNEIIYPVIHQRQVETEGRYFRFTEDNGEYVSRKPDYPIKLRRIRGYFPGLYYPVDFFEGKYDPGKDYQVGADGLIEERPKEPGGADDAGREIKIQIISRDDDVK